MSDQKKLLRNILKCKKCGDVIESLHVHDFVWCSCKSVFTDGGRSYFHRGGDPDAMEDCSQYEEEP